MKKRKSEKIGWIGGWLGGFVWLCLLSVLWLVQGRITGGVLALGMFAVAVGAVVALAPWKHPETRYWKLMLPVYALLAASLGLCIWIGLEVDKLGLSPWSLMLLMPLLLPFATVGARCWKDGDA